MDDLEAIGLLQDTARRALYEYVVGCGAEVGRNEAAEAVGIQRTLAAFHLDRLAAAGLLEVTYRRLSARTGPGAGRPAKLYRSAARDHSYSVPFRDYARAAQVLAESIERSGAEATLYAVAREQGLRAGQELTARAGAAVGVAGLLDDLQARGYAPYAEGEAVRLRNCPFHAVAETFPVVACGMNLALLEAVVAGAGLGATYAAQLDPRPGECCVTLVSITNRT